MMFYTDCIILVSLITGDINMKKMSAIILSFIVIGIAATAALAQEVLPFPPAQSTSIAGRTLAESVHQKPKKVKHLPDDAPNILIVLIDYVVP
jgi:arylsulfatase